MKPRSSKPGFASSSKPGFANGVRPPTNWPGSAPDPDSLWRRRPRSPGRRRSGPGHQPRKAQFPRIKNRRKSSRLRRHRP